MSAKLTHTAVLVALTQVAWLGAVHSAPAAAPEKSGVTTLPHGAQQKPLTREEAEMMLKEAHSAVEQGRLDDAEKILARIENAHVNFSVFHVGPTTSSVRRELTRARHAAQSDAKGGNKAAATTSKSRLPFARSEGTQSKGIEDPFAAKNALGTAKDATANASAPPALGGVAGSINANSSTRDAINGAANPLPVKNAGLNTAAGNLPGSTQLTSNEQPLGTSKTAGGYPVTTAVGNDNRYGTDAGPGLSSPQNTVTQPAATDSAAAQSPKQQAKANVAAARKALEAGDVAQAEKYTRAATSLGVPESEYLPDEDRPSLVAWDIARAKQKAPSTSAGAPKIERLPATTASRYASSTRQADLALTPSSKPGEAAPAAYRPENAGSSEANAVAASGASNRVTSSPAGALGGANEPGGATGEPPIVQTAGNGPRILPTSPLGDAGSAYRLAATAGVEPANEDLPAAGANVPGLGAPGADAAELPSAELPDAQTATPSTTAKATLIDSADQNMQVLARQLSAEVGKRQSEANRLQEKDPERAIATLHEAQQMVKDSKLPESSQRELLSRIEITLNKAEKYSKDHKSEIDLDKQNAAVIAARDRDKEMKLKLQQKIAEMTDEFNRLRDEQRYAEMEIVARRLYEMAPNEPVAQQVWQNAKFIRREMMNKSVAEGKEDSFWKQMHAVDAASVNQVAEDGHEVAIDKHYWDDFVKNRTGSKERVQRRTERELEIEKRLKTPVMLKYQDTPLTEVMTGLSELTGVNIHLDPRGLTQEGVNSDTPVTINLTKEISLKSALNLILEPLHLTYTINDEVLKITSEQLRDGQIYAVTYNVADLVTPIPNFVPSNNIGLQGLINDSMAAASQGRVGGFAGTGPSVLVNDRRTKGGGANGDVLAQQFNAAPTNGMSPSTVPIGAGPGGMGAGANADFDSLIDLIVSTVSTDTWAENGGGEAEIRPFPTNLSLVISQTQAVHEEIADLLQQLRRLQDLQVTIEVRFIRLNDSFFERIGIDFDMDINDVGVNQNNRSEFRPDSETGHTNTVGLLQPAGTNTFPNFTTDLDVPFRQDSFNLTQVVPFGGPVGGGANFGFAILSDIEAYFLIEAAQGDRRTNVLNAPKVTLFNGQQAFVADTTQRPFVVGVIPVVGEFAAAQQPVIVVLNEGTMMTIQAVVSDDRRYVRMTIVPFFTQIGDVDTFTFEGSSSSTSSSSATDSNTDGKTEKKDDSKSNATTGVTVQLPSFSFVSVVTTVSVPDGGTVLLGGIKRLSEGRNEFGVPLLSKVPYINRLFRNVAIGRETDSLMMMVTPRIIIQEEEEERLGVSTGTPPAP